MVETRLSAAGDGIFFSFDWASTPLGPPSGWSESFKQAVAAMIADRAIAGDAPAPALTTNNTTALPGHAQQLETAFKVLPVGVALFDKDGVAVTLNDEMRRFLPNGIISSRDPSIQSLWTACDSGGRRLEPEEFPTARALRGESVVPGVEMLYQPVDGPEIWTQVSSAPLRDGSGDISGAFTVVVDIDGLKRADKRLRESEERHSQIFESIDSGFCIIEMLYDKSGKPCDYRFVEANPAFERHTGFSAPLGRRVLELVPNQEQHWFDIYGKVATTGEPVRFEQRGEGMNRWFDVYACRTGAPEEYRVAVLFTDITARKATEAALRNAHNTFRHLVDRSPFGIYAIDADFRLVRVSTGAQNVFKNVSPLIGRDFAEILRLIWPEPFATDTIAKFRYTLATGEPYHAPDTVERRADIGETESYDWKIERIAMPDGRPGIVCHFYDLSERQRHEEHINLLMREINHRSKNMLTLVQAIARQTASSGASDFVPRFSERVQSLAAGQDLLIKHEWKAVPLHDLVRSQLLHFSDLLDERISIDGPALPITPAASQALGMALHELATNAAKYGALSNETGRIAIAWEITTGDSPEPQLALSWIEQNGPSVVAPKRKGFGSTVSSNMVRMSIGGDVATEFAPSGVIWRFSCPVANIADGPFAAAQNVISQTPAANVELGRRVLVVEDEPLIAAEIAALLAEAGFSVIGPAASVRQALALVERHGCDAAVLDVNLGDETSERIALSLKTSGTPFVVVSGYTRAQLPEIFRAAPLIGKPLPTDLLEAEVRRCLRSVETRH